MKKIITLAIALVMLCALCVPFATTASAAAVTTMPMIHSIKEYPYINYYNPYTVIYYGKTAFRFVGDDLPSIPGGISSPSGTWTLLAGDVLATDVQFDPKGKSNSYYDSNLKAAVESSIKLTDAERASIAPNFGKLLWAPTADDAGSVWVEYRKASSWWWLSSAGINGTSAAFVCADGDVFTDGNYVAEAGGVRPAFYLNYSTVLFMSAAVGGKSTVPVGGKAVTALQTSGSGWKLTLKDYAHRGFKASTVITPTETKITYEGAVTGPNEYITYYVADAAGNIVSYGRACAAAQANGTVTIPTPQMQSGSKLYVVNEQINGDYMTDYASEPQEAETPLFDGDYVIYYAKNPAFCFDIAGGAAALSNGDPLQLWLATNSGARVYSLKYDAAAKGYIITAKQSGKVLSVKDNVSRNGAPIIQWDDYGNLGQRWSFAPQGDGTYKIYAHLGGCILAVNGTANNGTGIVSNQWTGDSTFRLVPVSALEPEEGTYVIYSMLGNDMCFDIAGGVDAKSPGDDLWLWSASNSTAMTYNLIKDPETNSFKIVAEHSGLLLTAESSHSNGYANVYQDREYTDNNKYRQRWVFEAYDNGCYFIRSLSWGYMNVANANAANGSSIITFDYQIGYHEIFRLYKVQDLRLEDGDYIIYSALNEGKCFDIAGGTNALSNGDQLQLWDASSSGAKLFSIEYDDATDAYIIKAKQSGKVLDVEGGSTADGAKVWQWEDLGGLNQRWRFEKAENGYYYIRALEGKYLDVTEGKTANGTKIISFRFQEGARNQMFRLERIPKRPLEDGEYIFYSALNDTKCIEIEGNHSTAAGARVQLMSASFSKEKTFSVTYDAKTDAYIIKATYTYNRVLDVDSGSTEDGAKVWQWEDLGGLNQRWQFEKAEDGYYYIHAVQGLYMDVEKDKSGTYVLSRNFREGSPNQMFKPVKVSSGTANTGSVLSGGSWWIISGVSLLAIVGAGALLVAKKKKRPAAADGAGNDDDE